MKNTKCPLCGLSNNKHRRYCNLLKKNKPTVYKRKIPFKALTRIIDIAELVGKGNKDTFTVFVGYLDKSRKQWKWELLNNTNKTRILSKMFSTQNKAIENAKKYYIENIVNQ